MSKNIEIEAKGELTQEQYEKIVSTFEHPRFQYQTNFYIDTPHFELSKNHLGLRIRKEKDFVELTLKVPSEEGRLEINQKLSPKEFENFLFKNEFPKGEISRYLLTFYPKIAGNFSIFGTLHNQRLSFQFLDGEIALDHFTYFDQEKYEIECESASLKEAVNILQNYLRKFEIEYQKNTTTKLQRVIEYLN